MIYILTDETGLITNRIVLDDGADWTFPPGMAVTPETTPTDIGGTYINGVYTPPQIQESDAS